MKKLNIAILHLAFIYSGGGEKLVLQEYDGLKKRGHRVTIFTTVIDTKKSFPDIIKKYNIKTFLPKLRVFRGHESLQTVLSCILAPFYAFKLKKYDIILACNQPSPWIAYIASKIYGVPYVSYLAQPTRFLHQRKIDRQTGLFFNKKASESFSARLMMTTFKGFSDWADRVSIKNSAQILVNGEYAKKMIEKVYKVKAVSCPSGVNAAKNLSKIKNKSLLVTNRHFAQKRLEYAIFVLNKIVEFNPKFRLIITGSDSVYTQTLKSLTAELGMEKNVSFVGYVNEKELTKLYRNSWIYLYTAPEEDFGMGIIEAMAAGTPVVAWNTAGPARIITDGEDGLLSRPLDLQDFSDKVIKIVKDRSLARKLAANGIRKVRSKYSYKNHIASLEQALKTHLK